MKSTLAVKAAVKRKGGHAPRTLRAEPGPRFVENLDVWAAYIRSEKADSEESTEGIVWRGVETLIRVADADGCSVALAEWGVEMLAARRNGDIVRRTIVRDTMVSSGTLGHDAIVTGAPQAVAEVRRDRTRRYPEQFRQGNFASAACFPLGNRGRPIGVLTFYYRTPRSIGKRETDLGVILAHSMALSIDNSLLVSAGKENRIVTVQTLIRSLGAKDSDTSFHSLRVTQHATVLAEQMDLPPRQVEMVQYGATLHDLGKLGIIGTILNKRGSLSEDELLVVRRHPVIGARIIENVEYLADAVPIVRHHHEKFDGTGYPDGLSAAEIPLGARIVAIPDFYDALTSDRPYRAAFPHEEAVRMVRERRGTAFDPEIADIFLSIQERGTDPPA